MDGWRKPTCKATILGSSVVLFLLGALHEVCRRKACLLKKPGAAVGPVASSRLHILGVKIKGCRNQQLISALRELSYFCFALCSLSISDDRRGFWFQRLSKLPLFKLLMGEEKKIRLGVDLLLLSRYKRAVMKIYEPHHPRRAKGVSIGANVVACLLFLSFASCYDLMARRGRFLPANISGTAIGKRRAEGVTRCQSLSGATCSYLV